MKVLSLTQPWALGMAYEWKLNETRSWFTKYRGLVFIHAAKGKLNVQMCKEYGVLEEAKRLCGHIICVGDLVDCVPTEEIASFLSQPELDWGDYSPGRYAWLFKNMKALPEPVLATGKLGLWNWEG